MTTLAEPAPAPDPAAIHAALTGAQQGQDTEAILLHAAQLRAILPDHPKGYVAACVALRGAGRLEEAEVLASAGLQACPSAPGLLAEAAELARERGDYDLAFARWADLRASAPKSSLGYVGAARLAVQRQLPELTRSLLGEGLAKFPADRHLLVMAARGATTALRYEQAAAHWAVLLQIFPNEPGLALEAATSALGGRHGRGRRMPGILARLEELHTRFEAYVPAYTSHIHMLREAKRLEDADRLGADWCARFPNDTRLGMAWARVALELGRPQDAVARLEAVRGRVPPDPVLETAYIRALSLGGRQDDAEAVCAAARERFAASHALADEHVKLATRRGDFPEAAARAAAAAQLFPKSETFRRIADRMRALTDEGAAAAAAAPPQACADADFFLRFESLGATMAGCEFGLVQRQFGAEPLGLLRWASMPIANLTTALRNRLEGLGAPEHTRITIQSGSANHREYFIFDDRYGYWSHTFIQADDAPQDRVLRQSQRRIVFLRDKLLEDLEQASKIFVYKIATEEPPGALDALFDALRGYGASTLLCAMLEDEAHPRGTIEMPRPGLFVARASMFMGGVRGGPAGIDAELWRFFCEHVAAWHDEARTHVGFLNKQGLLAG